MVDDKSTALKSRRCINISTNLQRAYLTRLRAVVDVLFLSFRTVAFISKDTLQTNEKKKKSRSSKGRRRTMKTIVYYTHIYIYNLISKWYL